MLARDRVAVTTRLTINNRDARLCGAHFSTAGLLHDLCVCEAFLVAVDDFDSGWRC